MCRFFSPRELALQPEDEDGDGDKGKTSGDELVDHLAAQYGVMDTGTNAYVHEGYGSGWILVADERVDGLLGAEFHDYDGDNQVELLTVRLDPGSGWSRGQTSGTDWTTADLVISIYEVVASAPGLAAEARGASR